jgi:hypothetical protein
MGVYLAHHFLAGSPGPLDFTGFNLAGLAKFLINTITISDAMDDHLSSI